MPRDTVAIVGHETPAQMVLIGAASNRRTAADTGRSGGGPLPLPVNINVGGPPYCRPACTASFS